MDTPTWPFFTETVLRVVSRRRVKGSHPTRADGEDHVTQLDEQDPKHCSHADQHPPFAQVEREIDRE